MHTPVQGASVLVFVSLGNSEHMTIRMSHVHFTNVPWHVRRRPSYFDTLLLAVLMNRVDIVNPNRHPDAFVRGLLFL